MLLGDFAEAAPAAGVELSVTYLSAVDDAPAAPRLRAAGVAPYLLNAAHFASPTAMRALRRRIRSSGADIVHTHLDYADVLGGIAARALGVPAVSTVHVMQWDRDDLRSRVRLAVGGRVRRHACRRVVAVSDAGRAAYLQQGWDRPEHVVTIRNGVARRAQPGAGRAVRAALGVPPDALVATMLTVLRPGKGHLEAFAAMARLREAQPGVLLLVGGAGPLDHELREAAAPLGDAVRFLGHRDDVMAVLDASDVLLHPTRVDAFPTALLEAMAARVPVVATAVGGIPEIVEHDRTGLLLDPPVDAAQIARVLGALLADPARRRELGEAGAGRFAEQFSATRWMQRLTSLYDEVR